ncbi:FecR family protein [Algibacter miyuki]|uniref:FecR family protein n=1 Tax=Algibacter miyuki TaxID=1306933 RepID=A0ABV5H4V7_9FLAO|nr:FecR family protein [Algibacter miyuki]MDN3665860.1 FecR family protein [Algibacter miyuki]
MKYNQNKNQDFQNLIEKYLDGKITIEEVKKLVNYYESFQETHEWVEELGPESKIKNKMLINILESIQEKSPVKVIPFYKKAIFKYAVAASLVAFVVFGSMYKLQDKEEVCAVPTSNTIQIGSDKATLTLEDGSNIVLDKETSYESDKLKSNGKSVVYNKPDKPDKPDEELVYNYLTIPRGGQFFVELSDGTQVWLNSDSKLKYPVNFIKGKPREIELVYGEAYFDVSKSTNHGGDAFHLKTNEQSIKVLGTMFNVKAYRDETEIITTLVEGSVCVSNNINKSILEPKQQSKLSQAKNDFEISTVEVEDFISWRIGEFSFTNKSLEDIMKVLSRWYDVDVTIANEDMKSIGFTGIISKQQSIEYILEIIKNTNNMKYKIDDKHITIE